MPIDLLQRLLEPEVADVDIAALAHGFEQAFPLEQRHLDAVSVKQAEFSLVGLTGEEVYKPFVAAL